MVKITSLIPAALAAGSMAMPSIDKELLKRQDIGGLMKGILGGMGGKVPDPAGAGANYFELAPRRKGAQKTIKVRYGPYRVPNMNVKNFAGEEGTLWNYPDTSVKKPCDECYIVGINAGLEWPDGSNANINTGMWLHHMVMLSVGPGRSDPTCAPNGFSLPHFVVGASPRNSERVFSSGNERTLVVPEDWGIGNTGYKVKKTDKFSLIVDLMNDTVEDQVVYMTLTFDIADINTPNMSSMRPVWFDVAQCLTSDYPPLRETGAFQVTAPTWVADFDGDIIGMAGHLHDGGQNVTIYADGDLVCTSTALYGGAPEYLSIHEHPKGSAVEHISKMSTCVGSDLPVTKLKKGQRWVLKADYDYSKNRGSLHSNGKQESIMGIAIMYVKIKE